ncbi:FRG domain-containing protein [Candidatus Spyradosoma sp. SGI.093]|uniref:FRG domain-containing protein n=1 Tax=Candidatus Spyradosoma sp. SGI.093 TaxID=3420583 RepID=UPI003D01DCB1
MQLLNDRRARECRQILHALTGAVGFHDLGGKRQIQLNRTPVHIVGSRTKPAPDFQNLKDDADARYFFRGECAVFPDPTPGLLRGGDLLGKENEIFQDAQNRVPALFANCPTTFDKLCQMQHYGFPTRLIDISTDLAMAWFMAVDGWKANEVLRELNSPCGTFFVPSVLVLRVPREREKFLDSDLVATLSAVACMKKRFNSGRLRHEVAQERADFDEDFLLKRVREDCSRNYVVYPRMSNPRVTRQKGTFVLCGLTRENCELLARGHGTEADKTRPDARTGLCYPKIEWDPARRSEEISVCGRFVPSRKYFEDVSKAIAAGTRTYSECEGVREAVEKFRKKVFAELAFVGGGEADAYADDFSRQAEVCRASFKRDAKA